jgi:hypothetical protein
MKLNSAAQRLTSALSGGCILRLQTAWRRGRDSNPRYSFEALSLDVSVRCRLLMGSGESRPPNWNTWPLFSPVWIRRPFEAERRNTGDSVAESGQFCSLLQDSKIFGSDCALSAQSRSNFFLRCRQSFALSPTEAAFWTMCPSWQLPILPVTRQQSRESTVGG